MSKRSSEVRRAANPGAVVCATVGNHVGAGVASDHAAGVRAERHAVEVTLEFTGEDGRADILGDAATPQEGFGIAVNADNSGAARTPAAIVVKVVCAKRQPCARVQVERRTGMAGD